MRRLASLVAAISFATACGEETDPVPSTEVEEPTAKADGAWGTWQLYSLDLPSGGRSYATPYVELDLHPDGRAYRWTCLAGAPNGLRCPYYLRVGCIDGTIDLVDGQWILRFSKDDGTKPIHGFGTVWDEPSGDIGIDGEGILLPGAHYRRVAAASRDACRT